MGASYPSEMSAAAHRGVAASERSDRRTSLHEQSRTPVGDAVDPVRIAAVRYLEDGAADRGAGIAEFAARSTAVPSHIAGLVTSGRADLGLVSIIDAVREPEGGAVPLAIVPAGMIGCDGPTLTVRIFSSVPIEEIRELHADTDSPHFRLRWPTFCSVV